MHSLALPIEQLKEIKKDLLANKKRTKLEEKKLRAVTFQLEGVA